MNYFTSNGFLPAGSCDMTGTGQLAAGRDDIGLRPLFENRHNLTISQMSYADCAPEIVCAGFISQSDLKYRLHSPLL
jgi:hypothetical protein